MPISEGLEHPGDAQEIDTTPRVLQPHVHIRKQPPWALYAEYPVNEQAGVEHFCAEVFGAVKVCGGEVVEPPGRVPVLSFADILLDDRGKLRVLKKISHQTVQR